MSPWKPPKVPTDPRWTLIEQRADGQAWRHANGLAVIISENIEGDRRAWIHLSASRQGRLPTWWDLREAKETFIGDVTAIQVLPKKSQHVNLMEFCLHLFHCLDGDPLPDFTRGGATL